MEWNRRQDSPVLILSTTSFHLLAPSYSPSRTSSSSLYSPHILSAGSMLSQFISHWSSLLPTILHGVIKSTLPCSPTNKSREAPSLSLDNDISCNYPKHHSNGIRSALNSIKVRLKLFVETLHRCILHNKLLLFP